MSWRAAFRLASTFWGPDLQRDRTASQFILGDRNSPDTDRSRLFVEAAGEPVVLRDDRAFGSAIEVSGDEAADLIQPVFVAWFRRVQGGAIGLTVIVGSARTFLTC